MCGSVSVQSFLRVLGLPLDSCERTLPLDMKTLNAQHVIVQLEAVLWECSLLLVISAKRIRLVGPPSQFGWER